jgi:lipoprotein-anchoring transpeptidase ErfK/SrfK
VRATALVVVVMAMAGCGGSHGSKGADAGGEPSSSATATPTPARVTIRTGSGRTDVRPERGVRVRAADGTLTKVVVRSASGKRVTGTLNAKRTAWRSTWPLGVSERYRVTATAENPAGDAVTRRRSFRTLTPKSTFAARTIMTDGGTYGVGMPLIFYFDDPAVDRKAVERAMEIRTSKRVVGSWYWSETCGIVPLCLYFRPKHYWKPHTRVRWTAHTDGVRFKPGVYGDADMQGTIRIGRSLRVVASTEGHYMRVYKDGKRYARWPISTGKPGDDTPNGTYLSIEKHNPEQMVGADYDLSVPYAVRITWSGVYLHAASWSVGSQGATNVSHGCINMSPADAAIYYDMSIPGDPVKVVGSSRAGTLENGWTMWFKDWRAWRRGSALHEAVRAGPHGSTFFS